MSNRKRCRSRASYRRLKTFTVQSSYSVTSRRARFGIYLSYWGSLGMDPPFRSVLPPARGSVGAATDFQLQQVGGTLRVEPIGGKGFPAEGVLWRSGGWWKNSVCARCRGDTKRRLKQRRSRGSFFCSTYSPCISDHFTWLFRTQVKAPMYERLPTSLSTRSVERSWTLVNILCKDGGERETRSGRDSLVFVSKTLLSAAKD